ncbi:transmembrane protein 132C [Ochotona princeps]|uniref:transmembrane protein 132C n=1 Tax=Ochotona princeps TaxID=9978 RepID=UPI00271463E0|nr:transmembrane protein 132C [Ochotona princeps]
MRSEGAAPGPVAPLCGALSLVLGALLGKVIEGRGVPEDVQRLAASPPPYLPVSFRVLGAEAAFLLRSPEPAGAAPTHNCSLRSRAQAFFAFRAPRPPRVSASYGPFAVEKAVPPDLLARSHNGEPGPAWRLRASVLRARVSASRPRLQVLFHVAGRAWGEPRAGERLPCVRLWAFRDARQLQGGCRPAGPLGLCVAQLELPAGWFGPAVAVAATAGRRRPQTQAEGGSVELYYAVLPADERGDCAARDPRQDNAIRPGKDVPGERPMHLRRIGTVDLSPAQDGAQLSALRLDRNVVVWLPSRPAKLGEVVTAHITVSSDAPVDFFILRAKVKKGVKILSAQSSEPQHWDVKQEVGSGGKHTSTTVTCQRLARATHNRSSPFEEVVQMNFEVASFSSLSGSQPITWQVEYPRRPPSDTTISEVFVSQKDLAGIVPLAMDTELLNTAVLTGKTVALPVKVVSVEESGAVLDVSELVECKSTDEDVLKVSDRCDHVFVNGKEIKGRVDVAVNFTYQHLSAPLHVTVWVPRLPLQIDISDTELSQIKGWRVPVGASKRPTRESEEEEEEERRGRGCTLQFQRATVRVLTQFVSQGAGPWGQLSHLLGPDWQFDVTHLVADFMKLEEPHVATLQDGRILVGREVGMTTIQVLSPLSDSILAEKTVTVLDDKVSVTDLAIQLVAGLSATLHADPENSQAITAVATAEELLRTPKQEAVLSTWLQFSDGSVTPVDIYDAKDFSLTATSLDEAVVSVPQARSPRWPVVVAEGEGQGPLVQVDMTIAESCQKSKRKSVLAVGIGSIQVKFGQSRPDAGPAGDDDDEEEIENRASDRRHKTQDHERQGQDGRFLGSSAMEREEGALWRVPGTATSPLDSGVGRNSRLAGEARNIPIVFTHLPAQAELPAGAGLAGGDLLQAPRGLSDLEIGMYALLGVFCLAILVFLINCATFVLKYRHKQVPLEGQASVSHLHDWVWLGTEAELLDNGAEVAPPQDQHTTVLDRRLRVPQESSCLPLEGGAQKQVQGQVHRPPEAGSRQEAAHSPTSRRKKVQFATLTTIQPDDSCPTVNSIVGGPKDDISWVCPNVEAGAPMDLSCYLERREEPA